MINENGNTTNVDIKNDNESNKIGHIAKYKAHIQTLINLFVHALGTVMFLVFLSTMQPFLLQSIYDVQVSKLGETTANLGLADELWSICVMFVAGLLSDYIKTRTPILVAGYFFIGIANMIFPYANTVYPGVLMVRLLYATGGACLAAMLTAVVADAHDTSKIPILHLVVVISFASGVGALIGVFVLGSLPVRYCVAGSYIVMGVIAFIFGIVLGISFTKKCCGVKQQALLAEDEKKVEIESEGSLANVAAVIEDKPKPLQTLLSIFEGITLIASDHRVVLAYVSGFIARGGSILVTSYFSVWISAYYRQHNLCWDEKFYLPDGQLNQTAVLDAAYTPQSAACQEQLFNEGKYECRNGFTQTSVVGGVAQTLALIGTVIMGILFSYVAYFRSDPVKSVIVSSALGVIAYGAIAAMKDPSSKAVVGLAVIAGLAEIAMIIASQTLVVSLMSSTNRGKVAGAYGFFGGLGIIFVTYVGGRLFDIWMFTAPFAIMAILSAIVFILSIVLPRCFRKN